MAGTSGDLPHCVHGQEAEWYFFSTFSVVLFFVLFCFVLIFVLFFFFCLSLFEAKYYSVAHTGIEFVIYGTR